MSGFSNSIICVCVSIGFLYSSESQVTIRNLNGNGTFLCGYSTRLECAIPAYIDYKGMSWKLDGTLIAQCAFGSCTALGALPSGDNFTYVETAKMFNLDIGITHADNGTTYQCDDGVFQDQTTVNIQVSPSYDGFTTDITETDTSITVEAGCFYPSDAGRMDVYCVNRDGTEKLVKAAVTMTPTTTGCSGNCAGPNIYTAFGCISIDSSYTGGYSRYRFKVYHKDFKQYAISSESTGIYDCENEDSKTTNIGSVVGYSVGATSGFFILVMLTIYYVWRFRSKGANSETQDASPRIAKETNVIPTIAESYGNEESVTNYETLAMQNRDVSNYSDLVNLATDQYQNTVVYESM